MCGVMLNLEAATFLEDSTADQPSNPIRRFGYIKDSDHPKSLDVLRAKGAHHLHADHEKMHIFRAAAPLPSHVDLRPGMPPVFNQGNLNSCATNALVALVMYDLGPSAPLRSRQFLYWNSLDNEDCTTEDMGASMADGILALTERGICKESSWPYRDAGKQFSIKPTNACFSEASVNGSAKLHH